MRHDCAFIDKRGTLIESFPMSADVSSDFFISILDEKINILRAQLRSGQEPFSCRLQGQLAAALRIREKVRPTGSELENKPIDTLTEWSRWERDILAFEPRP